MMFSPFYNVQVLEIILFFVYIRSIHNTLSVHSFIIHATILTSIGGGAYPHLSYWRGGGLPFHSSWGWSFLPLILKGILPSTHPEGGPSFHSSWERSLFPLILGEILPLILGEIFTSTHPEGDPHFHSSWGRSFLPLILGEILTSTHPGGEPPFHLFWGRSSLPLILREILTFTRPGGDPSTHPGGEPYFHSSQGGGRSSIPLVLGEPPPRFLLIWGGGEIRSLLIIFRFYSRFIGSL